MTISEFVTATDNVKEKKWVEAYYRHETLFAGMRIIAKDTTGAEKMVEKEKQGELGMIGYKKTYSKKTLPWRSWRQET